MEKRRVECFYKRFIVGLIVLLISMSFNYQGAMNNKLTLSTPVFMHNALIPIEYTCDGKNISPELVWQHVPEKTKTFVLLCDDPDAPHGTWVHWLVFNIPRTVTHLPKDADLSKFSVKVGKNSWSQNKYGGPCPPLGTHRYFFKLYALDSVLNLDENAAKQDIIKAMEGHILDQAELIGLYARMSN